jgi:hypothetical protein
MPRSFTRFDWNDGNREKCRKHGVRLNEIEEALKHDAMMILPDVKHSDAEDRFIAMGRAENGRYLFVAFTLRKIHGDNWIRPVSARYMHEKEVKKYEKARTRIENR